MVFHLFGCETITSNRNQDVYFFFLSHWIYLYISVQLSASLTYMYSHCWNKGIYVHFVMTSWRECNMVQPTTHLDTACLQANYSDDLVNIQIVVMSDSSNEFISQQNCAFRVLWVKS